MRAINVDNRWTIFLKTSEGVTTITIQNQKNHRMLPYHKEFPSDVPSLVEEEIKYLQENL